VVAHGKNFVILVCTVLILLKSVTDGHTQTPRPWRSIAVTRKNLRHSVHTESIMRISKKLHYVVN